MKTGPPQAPPPLEKVPTLRKGLTFSFNDYDLDGKPQWVIHDEGRNKFFIIGWVEYELLLRWHLSNPQAILDSINSETTLHVEMDDLENLLRFLAYNYLIKQSGKQIHQHAKDQHLFKDDNVFQWLVTYYLFFRIPLVHPDKFLSRTQWITKIIFHRYTVYLMTFLGVVALYQVGSQWDRFTHTFPSIFTAKGLFFYFIAYMVVKLLHELGHAYMCKHYGIPVPSLGIAFLVFWPVLYTDTTLSWTLNNRQRMRIALAGIWVETCATIIAALIWCNTNNVTIQAICYVTITINWMSSLLINVSPFMRFDGYYVLADYLRMPNLQFRAFALTRWQLRKWLFGWQDPPPEKFSHKMHIILVVYSILTWIYRLTLYIGIAVLVYHFFIKAVGILLFFIEVYYFILAPFVGEFRTWYDMRENFVLNKNTLVTLSAATICVALFFIPISQTVKLPATMYYSHQFLFAPEEGSIESIVPTVGSQIKADQPIIILSSPEINYALNKVQLEYTQKLSELRRAAVDDQYAHQKGIIQSDLAKQKALHQKLLDLKNKMTLKVPFDGILIEIAPDLHEGTVIKRNEWLGDIINPHSIQVEAYVAQIDIALVQGGAKGYFYPVDLSESRIPVKVISIELLNPTQLTCHYSKDLQQNHELNQVVETPCYHASEFGGEIPTYATDKGEYVPVDSVYRVVLQTDELIQLDHVARGTVVVESAPRSYADRFFYRVKTILVEQSGF